MAPHRSNIPWLAIFISASLIVHIVAMGLGSRWIWRPPQFDMIVEPPLIIIQLAEVIEPPPPENVPDIMPDELELPEREPVPEPEIVEPEPVISEPEPVKPEPAPEPQPTVLEPEIAEDIPAEVEQLDQPVYLRNPAPPYPALARRQGWEGTVVLQVNVQADGSPESVAIIQSSGFPILDDAARKTLRRWKFSPAKLAGQPVSASVEIPISFRIKNR